VTLYIAPERRRLLEANLLGNFDDAWRLQAEWFEEPNVRRGGWSGVCRIALAMPGNGELGLFVKRQENHQRRNWRHPLRGEPTFAREFRMLRYLQQHDVPAPRPVFFGTRVCSGRAQGILITEELEGFRPLDAVVEDLFGGNVQPPLATQRPLLRGVAGLVRRLHEAGVQHGSLYPKHVFVRLRGDEEPAAALIDLEKSRTTLLSLRRTLHDLDALNRHSCHWSRSARLRFLLHYLGEQRLSARGRQIWEALARRAVQKRRD